MRFLPWFLMLALVLSSPACGAGGASSEEPELPAGTGPDDDGDGLGADLEREGWTILVDDKGFGPLATGSKFEERHVTSDPNAFDTDGDGLDDGREYLLRTDPSRADSDGDGLSDHDEWKRWLTSPVSVDTDGDARGPDPSNPLPPNPDLFDGAELHFDSDGTLLGSSTSPTLADTDGDGATDYEEVGHAFRSSLIAELPQARVTIDGPLDVRLNVEYAESEGEETSYGTTVRTETSTTLGESTATTLQAHASLSLSASMTTEADITGGFGVSRTIGATLEVGVMYGQTVTTSEETTNSLQQENSRLQSDSRERTETASSGKISAGIKIKNFGESQTFELRDLGITIRHWTPGSEPTGEGELRTMATLRPEISGFTLAPGSESEVILVTSTEVSADVIKAFLARPSSLVIEPAYYDLVNEDGISFHFLAENAFSQTAVIEIDDGNGTSETYRVATNVDRDESGDLKGITLGQIMAHVLKEDFETDASPSGPRRLTRLRGLPGSPGFQRPDQLPDRMWVTLTSNDEQFITDRDWEDIVVMPGDLVNLSYITDSDGNNVSAGTESESGCSGDGDCDLDGLTDEEEIMIGWWAGAPGARPPAFRQRSEIPTGPDGMIADEAHLAELGYPRWVRSNPRIRDTDEDGLVDSEERRKGTDPTVPDTDADGIPDGEDPFPLVRGRRLHVDDDSTQACPAPGDPLDPAVAATWSTALPDLQCALGEARKSRSALNAALGPTTNKPLIEKIDDLRRVDGSLPRPIWDAAQGLVTEIWVAEGTYHPTSVAAERHVPFHLVDGLAIFGGFRSDDQDEDAKRGARRIDPSRAVLSGDIGAGNADSYTVVEASFGQSRSTVLDGFTIQSSNASEVNLAFPERAHGGALYIEDASPTIRNVFFRDNTATQGGGALAVRNASPLIERCIFSENSCGGNGGAIHIEDVDGVLLRACQIISNVAENGGGAFVIDSEVRFEACQFIGNALDWISKPTQDRFVQALPRFDKYMGAGRIGGALATIRSDLVLLNCAFEGNTTNPVKQMLEPFSQNFDEGLDGTIDNTDALFLAKGIAGALSLEAESPADVLYARNGGAIHQLQGSVSVIQCTFARNEASAGAGIRSVGDQAQLSVVFSSFGDNRVLSVGSSILFHGLDLSLRSNIFGRGFRPTLAGFNLFAIPEDAGNTRVELEARFDYFVGGVNLGRYSVWPAHGHVDNRNCLFQDQPALPAITYSMGNLLGDPLFLNGGLVPDSNSPAVDGGNAFIDVLPFTPAFDPLPETDFAGNARVRDGNEDGDARPDIGAYER